MVILRSPQWMVLAFAFAGTSGAACKAGDAPADIDRLFVYGEPARERAEPPRAPPAAAPSDLLSDETADRSLPRFEGGRATSFDVETGTFPNEHDVLLRDLAALAGPALRDAVFEQVPPPEPDGEEGNRPYVLRAYAGGSRYEVQARALDDWYDVEAVVGLLNAVARDRASDVRFLILEPEGQVARVAVGPATALARAVKAGTVKVGPADEAREIGRGAEQRVIEQLKR
jgi:hypothetical protein